MLKDKITDVFFDLDHTLWDFEKNSALTFKHILKKHGVAVDLSVFLEAYVPINLKFWKLFREEKISKQDLRHQRLQQTFDAVGVQVSDATIDALAEDYIAHLSSYTHVFTGTFEVLDYLKDTYRLHIITNGFEAVQERKLKNSNLRPYFDVVVNSEMAGVKKPHPKIFKLALELAQVTPAQALMIGDSLEADILGAQNAGMAAIHFNSNKETDHSHCHIVHQLKEIKELL